MIIGERGVRQENVQLQGDSHNPREDIITSYPCDSVMNLKPCLTINVTTVFQLFARIS